MAEDRVGQRGYNMAARQAHDRKGIGALFFVDKFSFGFAEWASLYAAIRIHTPHVAKFLVHFE